jgi:CheY-like chemotaxis protein/two-component sensor histidine kinase
MEAMGQLTGGVAHDFNNLLTPIVGALDMLQRKQVGGEREQRLIAGAAVSAERARVLVQRLLAFARRQPLKMDAVDIGKLIEGMADLIASTTGPQIRVELNIEDSLPCAGADHNQLEMALLNLAVNARDAMTAGGILRIGASAETVAAGGRLALGAGRYVRLSVEDTGSGMDEDVLAQAIDPFFSTKGVGRGTGLGLSMVHGLVSQLNGALELKSRVGEGTTVDLWLPASNNSAPTIAADVDRVMPEKRGTVLLIDDEELVRLSTADMLTELGYEVIEAAAAEAALTLLDNGVMPDLLITDHLMPGMTGSDLARSIKSKTPALPVLIISGYAESEGISPDLPRLTKPFRRDDLIQSLAAIT